MSLEQLIVNLFYSLITSQRSDDQVGPTNELSLIHLELDLYSRLSNFFQISLNLVHVLAHSVLRRVLNKMGDALFLSVIHEQGWLERS